MSSVLEITNLCKKYPSFELKDVSFTMNEALWDSSAVTAPVKPQQSNQF